MAIKFHNDLIQGSDDWLSIRCGLLTASEVKLIVTPTFKIAQNDKERAHVMEILSQRVTGYVEPQYISDDMLRGMDDEIVARNLYDKNYGDVTECGFVTNDQWGFTLGYSPDGLVGDDGLIEIKSRRAKYQIETILNDEVPSEYMAQLQTALLVTERKWIDFISYCAGLPMYTKRVYPDALIQAVIIEAATIFHQRIDALHGMYLDTLKKADLRLMPTERKTQQEEIVL